MNYFNDFKTVEDNNSCVYNTNLLDNEKYDLANRNDLLLVI